ncbi:endosome/lysosome-associated apoptosis and autophagy regulator family member 2-like [Ptychodera flava]|uniref:endosome/lysosome-associated apoptosis and autophagy regulator family member 2-like n=1 Tax=Ptychodera flava TaxID=63121 RepID=UPI00396A1E72
MKCSGDCGFYFMEEDSRSSDVIESWEGSTDKQQYSYAVTKSGPRTFSWAFQKTDDNSFIRRESEQSNDMAVIYFINVTNTIDGGASVCKACPRGNNVKGCIPCPKGHYIADDNTCQQCPDGTYIHANNPYGKEACLACGPGTISHDNVVCYSDCQYKSPESQFIYDFSPSKGKTALLGTKVKSYHLASSSGICKLSLLTWQTVTSDKLRNITNDYI